MKNEVIGFLASIAAVVIFISLNFFYKNNFKEKMLQDKQRLVGIAVIIISIVVALVLLI